MTWNSRKNRKRCWRILTVLVVVAFACHPELRLLVPLLDSFGLDLFLFLISTQVLWFLTVMLWPYLGLLWERFLPAMRQFDRLLGLSLVLRAIAAWLYLIFFKHSAPIASPYLARARALVLNASLVP